MSFMQLLWPIYFLATLLSKFIFLFSLPIRNVLAVASSFSPATIYCYYPVVPIRYPGQMENCSW